MTKTGPLSKAEMFYIEHKYPEGMSVDDLCKELDRTKKSVETFIEKKKLSTALEARRETLLSQQFAKNRGSTVMTPNASILSDELRPVFNKNKTQRKPCITKIRDE